MNESENIIDFTLTEDNIAKALEGNDESYLIMVESEEESTSSDKDTRLIPNRLKGKFLNDAIDFYKAKCWQYIE